MEEQEGTVAVTTRPRLQVNKTEEARSGDKEENKKRKHKCKISRLIDNLVDSSFRAQCNPY